MTRTPQSDPVELMRKAKNGSQEAFGDLYRLYYVPVFRYIYFRLKSKEDAEDLAQTVFIKVFRSINLYQERGKAPLAYFFTVARTTIIDHWRKKKDVLLEDTFEVPIAPDNPMREALKNEAGVFAKEAIAQLSGDQQEVIVLKFINELSNTEIAQLLNKSEVAVRQLQSRALKALREIYQGESYEA